MSTTPLKGQEYRYPIKPRWLPLIGSWLFTVYCVLTLGYEALTNQRGLLIWDLVTFSPSVASLIYGLMATIAMLGSLTFLRLLYQRFKTPREIILTDKTITAPAYYLSNTLITLVLAEVIMVDEKHSGRQPLIKLYTETETLTLYQFYFPDKAHYQVFLQALLG